MKDFNFYKGRFECDFSYRAPLLAVMPTEKKVKLGWFHRLCLRFRWVKYYAGIDVANGTDYPGAIVKGHVWRGTFYLDDTYL